MIPVNILDTGKLLFLGILAARLQIMAIIWSLVYAVHNVYNDGEMAAAA